ncbi:MAG: DUF4190 domain-containing protein [Micromonosporaceae bacterium]|nr:DUF4190 domain-containing protein [Micromonosporaceae bacterium]
MTYQQQPGGWPQPSPGTPNLPPGTPAYVPPYGYPAPPRPTNGLAVASLVVSLVGALGLCAYGLGGWIGAIGAILGHVSQRQIRERGDGGGGMALAGVIVGWIATGLFVLAGIGWAIAIWYIANHPEEFESSTFMQLLAG